MVTQQIIMLDTVNVMVSFKQLYPCNDSNLCSNLVAQVLNSEIIVLGCRPFLLVTTELAVFIVSLIENLFLHFITF